MARFLELTDADNGLPVLVNVDRVTDMRPAQVDVFGRVGTLIGYDFYTPQGDQFTIQVSETHTQVLKLLEPRRRKT